MSESQAPSMEGLGHFREFMAQHGLEVRRDYVHAHVGACSLCEGTGSEPGTDDELCSRCGGGATEAYGGYWTVLLVRERQLHDGRLWARVLDVGEYPVFTGNEKVWAVLVENFDAMWRRDMEEV